MTAEMKSFSTEQIFGGRPEEAGDRGRDAEGTGHSEAGPNFNFAVFLGSLTAINNGYSSIAVALIAWVAIFSPGLILVHGTMGLWSTARNRRATQGNQRWRGGLDLYGCVPDLAGWIYRRGIPVWAELGGRSVVGCGRGDELC